MGAFNEEIDVFKEFTPPEGAYELRGQERKKNVTIPDKQTPHTTLQKLSPRTSTWSLNQQN